MQWLIAFLAGLLQKIFEWFAKRGLVALGTTATYIATYIGLYIAFCTATASAFFALEPFMPDVIPFVLSMFPPASFAMFNAYFLALVARRIFDWQRRTLKEFHSSMNALNY